MYVNYLKKKKKSSKICSNQKSQCESEKANTNILQQQITGEQNIKFYGFSPVTIVHFISYQAIRQTKPNMSLRWKISISTQNLHSHCG